MESSSRWSYSVGRDVKETLVITEEFLLHGVHVNFSVPPVPTFPTMNWTRLRELNNFTYHHLPDLRRLTNIHPITSHNSYVVWILLAITLLIACLAAGYILYRRHYLRGLPTKLSPITRTGTVPHDLDNSSLVETEDLGEVNVASQTVE
eukprot:GHVO01065642.1.p2 GENE.GHVO01065642.1~~GHVO01065642.1.p2  ORF type:complete len:149 (-),score=11.61 GHVO01065642.1:154-600(-)